MIFNLNNPFEVDKYKEYVNKLFKDRAVVEVKKRLPNRTLKQNSYLHLILSFFACELGYSLDEVKLDYFKKTCNLMIFKRKKKKEKPLFDITGAKIKKKPDLKAKLDKEFSLFIRLRDAMPNGYFKCISCGQIKPFEQADNGHYINRQHMNARFDEMNCNAQCRHCNRFMEGNIQNYRKGLVAKYGEQRVILLESKQAISRQFTEFEYKELIKYYKALSAKLRKEKGI